MAKISAHGTEIGTVYFMTSAKRYMSDNKILRNQGFGWKLGPKLKPGITAAVAYQHQIEHQAKVMRERPALTAYRSELHSLAGLSRRWKLHAAVTMMPQDPDGVWSEACDGYGDNCHADIDEIVKLCQLWLAAEAETKRLAPIAA